MNKDIPNYSEMVTSFENYEKESNELFLNGLNSVDEYVVWYAAKACGLKLIIESIPKLVELLGKPCNSLGDTDIRRISAWSLSKFDYHLLCPYFENADMSNILLIEGLCDTIGMMKIKEGIVYLDRFMNIYNDSIYLWASLSLSKIGEESISTICKYIDSIETTIAQKIYLLDSLKKIDTLKSRKLLGNYLNEDKFKDIRSHFKNFMQ